MALSLTVIATDLTPKQSAVELCLPPARGTLVNLWGFWC
jgi:hypothetical protein